MFALPLWLWVGCGAPPAPNDSAGTTDTQEASAVGPGTWEVGEPESCPAPVAAHWTDQSERVWDGSYYPEHMFGDVACVALELGNNGWKVWASGYSPLTEEDEEPPPIDLLRVDLATGERTTFQVPHLYQHLAVDDLDGDGLDDIAVFQRGGTVLWGGTTELQVLDGPQASFAYAPLDLDGDGRLDLVALGAGEGGEPPGPQTMWNLGDRTFGPPTAATTGGVGQGFAGQVLDWDDDGDPDIYQCNDAGGIFGPNVVLVDEGGELQVGDDRGAGIEGACMSSSFGDVDGDGTLDIYLALVGPQSLLLDRGDGFVDVGESRLLLTRRDEQMGWSSVTVDADNDGLPDIVVTTGDFGRGENGVWPTWLLQQQPDGTFVDVGAEAGLPQDGSPRGLVLRDINADGVVDALIGDVRRQPYLLMSDGCTEGAWVEVGAPSGTVVTVEAGGRTWTALASRQDGWCGWAPAVAHIGLGDAKTIDRIRVKAPWHAESWIEDIPTRSRLTWRPED